MRSRGRVEAALDDPLKNGGREVDRVATSEGGRLRRVQKRPIVALAGGGKSCSAANVEAAKTEAVLKGYCRIYITKETELLSRGQKNFLTEV